MTETAKSKIKNFKNQITEKFNVGEANGFRTYIGKLSPINVLDMLDDIERSVTTDKLSIEKLQEIRVEELKDFNSKILQAELKNQKFQERLNTAKKALTEIADVKRRLEQTTDFGVGFQPTYNALEFVVAESKKALAAIRGGE